MTYTVNHKVAGSTPNSAISSNETSLEQNLLYARVYGVVHDKTYYFCLQKESSKKNAKDETKSLKRKKNDTSEQNEPEIKKRKKDKKKKKKTKKAALEAKSDNEDKSATSDEDEQLEESSVVNEDLDMSAWNELFVPPDVLKALREQGFSEPTPIQRATLPAAIKGRLDIMGAAETGSGKTLGKIL